jgi:hypothetical protein
MAGGIKWLKQGVAQRVTGDAGQFWQKRYYDFNVRNHPQFVEAPPHALEPREAGIVEARRRLAAEQLSPSRNWRRGRS